MQAKNVAVPEPLLPKVKQYGEKKLDIQPCAPNSRLTAAIHSRMHRHPLVHRRRTCCVASGGRQVSSHWPGMLHAPHVAVLRSINPSKHTTINAATGMPLDGDTGYSPRGRRYFWCNARASRRQMDDRWWFWVWSCTSSGRGPALIEQTVVSVVHLSQIKRNMLSHRCASSTTAVLILPKRYHAPPTHKHIELPRDLTKRWSEYFPGIHNIVCSLFRHWYVNGMPWLRPGKRRFFLCHAMTL